MAAPPLQQALARAFAKRNGCAVVLRRDNGATLAAWRPDLMKTWTFTSGSAVKPFILEVLLRINPRPLPCLRRLRIGALNLDCMHPAIAASLSGSEALAVSCNSWFARQSLRLKPDQITAALAPLRPDLAAPQSPEEQQLLALGLGSFRTTAMQLARAYRDLAATASTETHAGLREAVRIGTAQHAGDGVSGKTGTTRDCACFAGFNGDIVVAVALPGGTGGGDAAPIAGEVFRAWRDLRQH